MLPWKNKSLELWISPTQTTLYILERGGAGVLIQLPRDEDDLALHFARCVQALPNLRSTLRIVMDDSMVKFLKVEPPKKTAHFEDLCAAARIRFEALYDLPTSEWELQGDWDATKPFLVCAAPANILSALRGCLNETKHRRTKIASCVPAFIHCWNQQQPYMAKSVQGIGVVNETTVTVAIIQNSKLIETRNLPLVDVGLESMQRLDQAMQNLGLQLNLKIPEVMWLTGRISPSWMDCETDKIFWRRLSVQGAI